MTLTSQLIEQIKAEIKHILPQVKDLRHRLHQEPEIGLKEYKTREKIVSQLNDLDLEQWQPLLGTDVIAELNIDGVQETVGLRADIDALPIKEDNQELPYSSTNGCMHACGHDGHTAMLVGVAKVLNKFKAELTRNVRFIFQPGEELICAGKKLVAAGACKGLSQVYATHCWPGLDKGQVSTKTGILFSCGGHFDLTIHGKGCHGAQPENGNNPISAASDLVLAIEKLHEQYSQKDGSVVTICHFKSGFCSNVIPDSAVISGTFRADATHKIYEIEDEIKAIAQTVTSSKDCSFSYDGHLDYDTPTVNSQDGFEKVQQLSEAWLPNGSWLQADKETKGMEDFAFYLKEVQNGAMYWLGTGKNNHALHNPKFDFPDDAMENGILLMTLLALA